jgi:hypothetical protein
MQMTVQQWLNSPDNPEVFKPFPPDGDMCCGSVLYDSKERVFRIHMGADFRTTYDMQADRILSGAGFLDFLLQIHGKDWVTGQHLKDLMDCVTCWVYRDHGHRFPQEFFGVAWGMNKDLDDPGEV